MATATASDIKILYACGRFMLILRIINILSNSFWQQIKSYSSNRSAVETSPRYIPRINKTSDTNTHTQTDRYTDSHKHDYKFWLLFLGLFVAFSHVLSLKLANVFRLLWKLTFFNGVLSIFPSLFLSLISGLLS